MDDLMYARLQMAVSLGFHIVFAAIGIAMPAMMALSEWRWIRTGRPELRRLTRLWATGTAVFFAVGAVSGTVLSFELGLLWPAFMEHAGAIIGTPFGLEGFAFFTEAIFLGLYLYGWDRMRPAAHLACAGVVAVSGAMSAVFIIMVNGWMNSPRGFDFDPETGVFSNIDPVAAMFNEAWLPQTAHMLLAAYMATGFAAAGAHAFGLLRRRDSAVHREGLKLAMAVGLVAAVLQPISGDWAAKVVAERQPAKLAAMEGQWETETRAPLRIGGLPNEETERTPYSIEIPGLLSFLAFGDFDAEVTGLKEFAPEDRPPVAITHLSFQGMVACGMAMLAVGVWWAAGAVRRREPGDALLRAIIVCAPLGFIAIELGWIVTEVGRQPWVIQGVMRTSEAVTQTPNLAIPFWTFTLVYVFLSVVVARVFMGLVRASLDEGSGARDGH